MRKIHIRNFDLNLLPILTAVVEARSVTIAADRLGMTQSAVSQALSRMRKLWKDPLVVRTGRGMQATPHALALTQKFRPALEMLTAALEEPAPFDPMQADRTYTISISGGGDEAMMPDLMETLTHRAPGISLHTIASSPTELQNELEDGRVDLVIDYILVVPGETPASPAYSRALRSRKIFEEQLVILDAAWCASDAPMTLETYAARPHVGFSLPVSRARTLDRSLARQGVRRDIRFRMPTVTAIPPVVEKTGCLATIPASFAAQCENRYRVKACAADFPLPNIAIYQVWHAQTDNDPAETWLRDALLEVLQPWGALSARPQNFPDR